MQADQRTSLSELSLLFFRLGTTAFGGPAAHIAMMHDEVVVRRHWLNEERFLDLLGATNLIPGPNSTEMAIHIGWERRRWAGLAVAGIAFILPAVLITSVIGRLYVRYGSTPSAAWLLYGIKPVILAVVVQAIWSLAPKAAKTGRLLVLAVLAFALALTGVHELAILFGAGAVAVVAARRSRITIPRSSDHLHQFAPVVPLAASIVGATAVTLPGLFWVFLKIGSVLFGSGYVLLAFLRADLVHRLGWLTEAQLIDAIAVGQVTPGPVFTTATFIGYLLSGLGGALTATFGIFLPAFVLVALSGPLVPKLRASPAAGAFLDGVNVASLALMTAVTVQLARAALVDVATISMAIAATLLLIRVKVNTTWLLLAAAGAGWVLKHFDAP
jgi:chromate transporter